SAATKGAFTRPAAITGAAAFAVSPVRAAGACGQTVAAAHPADPPGWDPIASWKRRILPSPPSSSTSSCDAADLSNDAAASGRVIRPEESRFARPAGLRTLPSIRRNVISALEAATRSWVAMTTVAPSSLHAARSALTTWSAPSASISAVGSSASTTAGLRAHGEARRLLPTAGEHRGKVVRPRRQPHALQQGGGSPAAIRNRPRAGEQQGKLRVLGDSEVRDQVLGRPLPQEADRRSPVCRQ